MISRIKSCEFEIYYKERHKCLLIERGATAYSENRMIHKGASSMPKRKSRTGMASRKTGIVNRRPESFGEIIRKDDTRRTLEKGTKCRDRNDPRNK